MPVPFHCNNTEMVAEYQKPQKPSVMSCAYGDTTRWRVMRYKGGEPPLMISSPARADDMPLLSQWIKKFDKSKLVEFFALNE